MKRLKAYVQKNLRMSEGKAQAQCMHAAVRLYIKDPQEFFSAVSLGVSTKKFYEAVEARVDEKSGYVVTDAGLTEVPAGSHTVVAWWEEDDGKEGE